MSLMKGCCLMWRKQIVLLALLILLTIALLGCSSTPFLGSQRQIVSSNLTAECPEYKAELPESPTNADVYKSVRKLRGMYDVCRARHNELVDQLEDQ